MTFKVHCGFENTCTRTPGTTHKSVPGIDFFLFLKDIYFTLNCRWMWQHLEICILNTYRIYSHCSCYWTHDFYEILVNVLTNALKPWWFIIFYQIVYINLLIVILKSKTFFVSRMARRVIQEINEIHESQIEMDNLIPNGTGLECIL